MKKIFAGSVAVLALAAIVPLTAVHADEHKGGHGRGQHGGDGQMMRGGGDGEGKHRGGGHMMHGDGEGRGHMDRDGRHHRIKARIRFMKALERFDANDDGSITQEEVDQYRTERLQQFDADGNGQLSLEEYQALWLDVMHKRMVRRFQKHDENGDGQITPEEFAKSTRHMVMMRDKNDDGVLNMEDVKHGRMGGHMGGDGMMRGGMMHGGGMNADDAGSGEGGEKSE